MQTSDGDELCVMKTSSMIECEVGITRKMCQKQTCLRRNWNILEFDTTELESYKQVEPRDGGKKLGFAERTTGLLLALGAED